MLILCGQGGSVTVEDVQEEGVLLVRWPQSGSSAKVGVTCGRLLSWGGPRTGELLCAPVDLSLYRAGTDNDRGGGFFSYYERWKGQGIDSLSRKGGKALLSYQFRPADGALEVSLAGKGFSLF